MSYTEEDLRNAFRAGWQERNRNPGLRRKTKQTLGNGLLSAMGGGRYADVEYIPDKRTYHNSIWLNSAFKKDLG